MVVPTETPETAQPICRPMFFSSTFSHLSEVIKCTSNCRTINSHQRKPDCVLVSFWSPSHLGKETHQTRPQYSQHPAKTSTIP